MNTNLAQPQSPYVDLSIKLQQLLGPHEQRYPVINTIKALDWLNDGLDPDKQILPIIEEHIERKRRAGKPIPTSLNYYDRILQDLKASPQKNIVNETEEQRDLRLAKAYRWKIAHLKGKDWMKEERALAAFEGKYGADFGLEMQDPR